MILSDKEIKTDDWETYSIFKQSHLEANAELRKAGERIRELENELVLAEQLLNWIDAAIDGERVCDFAESFPLKKERARNRPAHNRRTKKWNERSILS